MCSIEQMTTLLQHDPHLRAAARAIYDACYPAEVWQLVPFDEAERNGATPYRNAVYAAQRARAELSAPVQPALPL